MEVLIGIAVVFVGLVIVDALTAGAMLALFEPLRWWLTRVASKEPRTAEQVSCSIRAVEASPYCFTRRWTVGVATLERGVIRFVSGGNEIVVAVSSIGPLAADMSRGVVRSARVRVYTEEGTLEVSLQRPLVERLRQIVLSR